MYRMRSENLYKKLSASFQNFERISLITANHEVVYLKYHTLADIGTLQQSAEVAHNYLQLQDGDIVITNDPYSGGTLLSSPTLVLGIGTKTSKGVTPAEFLISSRMTFLPRVGPFNNLDEEGLRIPPSPFYIKGDLNSPIVEALKNHPLAKEDFINRIIREAEKLLSLRANLKNQLQEQKLDLSRNTIKEYLNTTTERFLKRLEDVGEGSTSIDYEISESELIRLKLEHHDGIFNFDFSGSSPGHRMFLTDTATFGVAVGATLSLLQENIPINSGVLSRFDIKAPRGSLLNSTFPRSIYLGHTDGLNLLANLILKAFYKINKKQTWALSGPSHCSYELVFRDGRVFYDALPTGVGATENSKGLSGVFAWRKNWQPSSIEQWEAQFPIEVLQAGFRSNSGGDGKNSGGEGVSRSLLLLEDAELRWNYLSPPHQPDGIEGGKSALGPEMIVKHAKSEEPIKLSQHGKLSLSKGDIFSVLTAGGGGHGSTNQ